jgi:hypothetical protein
MKNGDFTDLQLKELNNFLKASKKCIKNSKLSPSYLLYLISIFPDESKQDVYTKVNRTLLRDLLPKKKRIHLDFLIKKLKELEN